MPTFLPLRAALPPFALSAGGTDASDTAPTAEVREYLAFYQLDTLPGRHSIGWISAGRYRLAVQHWAQEGAADTVLLVHGYYDHTGLYRHLIDGWLARGYSVLVFDLPGHGLSDGPRAVIDSFDDYADALSAVLAVLGAQGVHPHLAVGQSTGCAVLLNFLMTGYHNPFRRLILLAPLLRPHRWAVAGRWTYLLLHRWITMLPRRFTDNCSNAEFLAFCRERDPLQPRWLSVAWVAAMKDWLERFADQPAVSLPTLVLQGQRDTTVDWRYNIPQILGKLPHGELDYLAEARHHLANESPAIRAHIWQLIDRFLDRCDEARCAEAYYVEGIHHA